MKEVKHFICEICGTEYNDKNNCLKCEKGHKTPVKILHTKYLPITSNALGIPHTITIEMQDGSTFDYKR